MLCPKTTWIAHSGTLNQWCLTSGTSQAYADNKYLQKGYEIDMSNQKVTNLADPTEDDDAVTKSYLESHTPKGLHKLLLHCKADFVSNGSALFHKDKLVNDYFFSGTSSGREVTITFNNNIPDGFYAYDIDIRRSAGKSVGMDILMYGTPNDTEFICKTLYRFWAKNVNNNGANFSTGHQNKQAGRF